MGGVGVGDRDPADGGAPSQTERSEVYSPFGALRRDPHTRITSVTTTSENLAL